MKINAESQKKQSDQPRNKTVLKLRINQLFLSALCKNTNQIVFKAVGIERFNTQNLY